MVREDVQLLGGRFRFESNSSRLLRLVDSAYAGLPRHRLSAVVPRLTCQTFVETRYTCAGTEGPANHRRRSRCSPEPVCLAARLSLSNFVVVSPRERAALVAVTSQVASFFVPYPLRVHRICGVYPRVKVSGIDVAARRLRRPCGPRILLMGPKRLGKIDGDTALSAARFRLSVGG